MLRWLRHLRRDSQRSGDTEGVGSVRGRDLVARAQTVRRDSPEGRVARKLTRMFNATLPWYARVRVIPLPDGWGMTERWAFWSFGTQCAIGTPLLDQRSLVNIVLAMQSFVAGDSGRSWPLGTPIAEERSLHRADRYWINGQPLPSVELDDECIRIAFGNPDEPVVVIASD
jgi:hypothetical protein